jgi:hypothetical protein
VTRSKNWPATCKGREGALIACERKAKAHLFTEASGLIDEGDALGDAHKDLPLEHCHVEGLVQHAALGVSGRQVALLCVSRV